MVFKVPHLRNKFNISNVKESRVEVIPVSSTHVVVDGFDEETRVVKSLALVSGLWKQLVSKA